MESSLRTAALAATAIRDLSGVTVCDFAIVLGSGWAEATGALGETLWECPAHELPGFFRRTVAGHGDAVQIRRLPGSGKLALVYPGRTHLYENRDPQAVAHNVRVAAELGCSEVLLTNSCGAVSPGYRPGQIVVIRDHINLTGISPLEGPQFVDMSVPYSERLRALIHGVEPQLPEGVYVQFPGPQYETPAEIGMAKVLGGQVIGMSTAIETIAARAVGLEVAALSLVTNMAAGIARGELRHDDVLQTGRTAESRLSRLLARVAEVF